MFQLSEQEWEDVVSQNTASNQGTLRSQNAILKEKRGKHRKYLPYVFTEQGVAGLSGILKSERAVKVHIEIMRAFVNMRRFLLQNASVFQRLDQVELRMHQKDEKFDQIFKALDAGRPEPDKGIFFDGQVFDAYAFVSDLIRKAKKEIILIDNYIDERVLSLLSKRNKGVNAIIYTKAIPKTLQIDLEKYHAQYPNPSSINFCCLKYKWHNSETMDRGILSFHLTSEMQPILCCFSITSCTGNRQIPLVHDLVEGIPSGFWD